MGKKDEDRSQEIFSTAVLIHIIVVLVVIVLAESVGVCFLNNQMNIPISRLAAANWVFQFSLITFIVNIISILYDSTIAAHERMAAFAYTALIESTLKLFIVYLLILSTFSKLIIYEALMLLVSLAIRITYGVYCSKNFIECKSKLVEERFYYKQILGFSGWGIIGSSSVVLTNYGIGILLNIFFGVVANMARGIMTQVDSALNQFVNNFVVILNPQITKSYASGNRKYMMRLVMTSSRYSFYLLLIMAIPILFETEYILTCWLKNTPKYTVIFVQLSLIYVSCQSLLNTLLTAVLTTSNIRNYQIIVGGLTLMAFSLSYGLFRMGFEPAYCYYATIFIPILCFVVRLIMLHRIVGLSIRIFFKDVIVRVILVSVFSLTSPYIITSFMTQGLERFVILPLVSLVATCIFTFSSGMSRDERTLFITYIRNKFNRRYERKF